MRKGLPTVAGRGFLISKGVNLGFTQTGLAYAHLPLAFSYRRQVDDEWVTEKEVVIQATAWGPLAEYLADQVPDGEHAEIDVAGELYFETYKNKDGEEVPQVKMTISAAGVVEQRKNRSSGSRRGSAKSKPQEDPWADVPSPSEDQWGSAPTGNPWSGTDDEPPF
jgi:single-stranded DNA-binding protein